MGSNEDVQLPGGKTVRGRAYRWGTVEGEYRHILDKGMVYANFPVL